jgi:hypothetical protein
MHGPRVEQLYGLTAVRIVRFDSFNALDRIATAEREEWIAAPFGPLFEAAKRSTGFELIGILPSPAPNGQSCGEKLGSTAFNVPEEVGSEMPLLRVLAVRVEFADHETACQVIG